MDHIVSLNLQKIGAALAIVLGVLGLVREDTRVAASVENQTKVLEELKADVKQQGSEINALNIAVAKLQKDHGS